MQARNNSKNHKRIQLEKTTYQAILTKVFQSNSNENEDYQELVRNSSNTQSSNLKCLRKFSHCLKFLFFCQRYVYSSLELMNITQEICGRQPLIFLCWYRPPFSRMWGASRATNVGMPKFDFSFLISLQSPVNLN